MILLPRPSIYLNKSLTRLKAVNVETLFSEFLSAKFDNVSSTFFVYHLSQNFFHSQTVLGQWHSSLDPQFIWKSPWLDGKAVYVETLYSEFLSSKFDIVSSTFIVYYLGKKNIHPSNCTRTVTLLPRPSIYLNKFLTRLKAVYVETLYSEFLSAKFDIVSSTFLVYHLSQNFFHSQTVLGQWHSSLDPQFIWRSPWLDWKQFILKHYIASFWARNLTTYQALFSYTT